VPTVMPYKTKMLAYGVDQLVYVCSFVGGVSSYSIGGTKVTKCCSCNSNVEWNDKDAEPHFQSRFEIVVLGIKYTRVESGNVETWRLN